MWYKKKPRSPQEEGGDKNKKKLTACDWGYEFALFAYYFGWNSEKVATLTIPQIDAYKNNLLKILEQTKGTGKGTGSAQDNTDLFVNAFNERKKQTGEKSVDLRKLGHFV